MNDDKDIFHLLANPVHIKQSKKRQEYNIDNDLFAILHKRFPFINVNEYDRQNILEKIESLLTEISIKNIIKEVLNNIISSVIFENEYRVL